MKENTALAASMPCVDWDCTSRDKREKIVRKALKRGDVELLVSLTDHNLLMFGNGGAHTSPHTRRAYATGVWVYLAYALPLGWERMNLYDTDLTVGYMRQLERAGVKPGTINSRCSAARALYRALRWAGVLQADPFGDTPRAQDNEDKWAKREAYSKEDIERLLAVAGDGERLLILLGAHGALRMSEMVALDWSHIDLEARTMRIDYADLREGKEIGVGASVWPPARSVERGSCRVAARAGASVVQPEVGQAALEAPMPDG